MTEKKHTAEIHMAGEPYVARVGDATIAASERAMILREVYGEKAYPPVVYFPRDDVAPEALLPSDHHSHCPIKGDAGYFSIEADGQVLENAAWTYRDPLPTARAVKGYVAFYPDKVTVEQA